MSEYPKITNAMSFLPDALREIPFWLEITKLMDIANANPIEGSKDINYKYVKPEELTEEDIRQIFIEMGYGYFADVMETVSNYSFYQAIAFFAWVQLWKGSKKGYSLSLKLLGLDIITREWWENPGQPPWTHDLTLFVDTSYIKSIDATLAAVRNFSSNYVYSQLRTISLIYQKGVFAKTDTVMGGWWSTTDYGYIVARKP